LDDRLFADLDIRHLQPVAIHQLARFLGRH
jgi:hypothetical protein